MGRDEDAPGTDTSGWAAGRCVDNLTRMTDPGAWGRGVSVAGLAAVFLAAITAQAVAITRSWGSWYWVPGGVAAAAVCVPALLGLRRPLWPAVAGFGLAAAAIAGVRAAGPDLPAEPSRARRWPWDWRC